MIQYFVVSVEDFLLLVSGLARVIWLNTMVVSFLLVAALVCKTFKFFALAFQRLGYV